LLITKYIPVLLLTFSITGIHSQDTTIKEFPIDTIYIKNKGNVYIYEDSIKDPNNYDVKLFRSINKNRSKFKDAVIPIFDKSAPPITLIMPISTMFYSRFKKNYYDENTGYLLGGSEFFNLLLTFGIKSIVQRPRPFTALNNVYSKNTKNTDPYSFPSGHTSISFTMAVMLNLRYPGYPEVYVPVYFYSLIVAYGRPYLGMHYPSDLLGGALIGAGSSALIFSLRSELFKLKNKVLSEDKPDEGSINGKMIYIFGGAFAASSLLGQLLFKDNDKIQLSVLPYGKRNEMMSVNFNIRF
jgi:membrane-associated phospholipid phosphatase